MHVKEGKPEQFTPEEGSAFDEADTLFRGLVISVLGENLVDSYVWLPIAKRCGILLRLNMECLTPAVSCI